MLVCLVWWVAGSRLATFCADSGSLLLDEDIGNEIVDQGWVDWRIRSRPQDNARGGQDLEGIQHDGKETLEVEAKKEKVVIIKSCANT